MAVIARCLRCRRHVWPWQRYGFWIKADGTEVRWHRDHDARSVPAFGPPPEVRHDVWPAP